MPALRVYDEGQSVQIEKRVERRVSPLHHGRRLSVYDNVCNAVLLACPGALFRASQARRGEPFCYC
jgi:hypothetical protein